MIQIDFIPLLKVEYIYIVKALSVVPDINISQIALSFLIKFEVRIGMYNNTVKYYEIVIEITPL